MNAWAAMYWAYIMPSRAARSCPFHTAVRRCWAVSRIACSALPRDGWKFSRDTYGSEACASTSNPHCAV